MIFQSGANNIEYDSDGIPVGTRKGDKSVVEPLPQVDHSTIKYLPFKKIFYKEHADVSIHPSCYNRQQEYTISPPGVCLVQKQV